MACSLSKLSAFYHRKKAGVGARLPERRVRETMHRLLSCLLLFLWGADSGAAVGEGDAPFVGTQGAIIIDPWGG